MFPYIDLCLCRINLKKKKYPKKTSHAVWPYTIRMRQLQLSSRYIIHSAGWSLLLYVACVAVKWCRERLIDLSKTESSNLPPHHRYSSQNKVRLPPPTNHLVWGDDRCRFIFILNCLIGDSLRKQTKNCERKLWNSKVYLKIDISRKGGWILFCIFLLKKKLGVCLPFKTIVSKCET